MEELGEYNLFVGGLSGIFKGIRVSYLKGIHNVKNLQSVKEIINRNELRELNWGDNESEILLGYSNQQVRIYDLQSKSFTFDKVLQHGEGGICGISKYNGHLLTGVESGSVCVWGDEDLTSPTSVLNTKGPLECVRHCCADRNIVATGGKENDLSLWNLETQQTVFQAKNVRHDELELRVPIWVSDVCFVPNTQKVAVCTRYGHVRLYDPSTQTRRPVVQVEIKDQSLFCIAVTHRDHHVVVGSGTGNMYLVDLRGKGVLLNHYKGFVGSIRQIVCTPSEPYIASVSLDRHLRIHNLDTKQLLHKEYLQSQLSCILANSSFTMSADQVDIMDESEVKQEEESVVNVGSDEEYETMFDNMDVVMDGEKKTKKEKKSNTHVKKDDTIKNEKDSETEIAKDGASKEKNKIKGNFVKTDFDSETVTAKDVGTNMRKKGKNYGTDKKCCNASSVENNLIKVKNDSETEICTEVAIEKKKKIRDGNVEEAVGDKETEMASEQEDTTETEDREDSEIIEVGHFRNVVNADEVDEVETVKAAKKSKDVDQRNVESKDFEVIEIDNDADEENVEVETINEFIVQRKSPGYDTDSDIEDDDSDIIEIYRKDERERFIDEKLKQLKELMVEKYKAANPELFEQNYDTNDTEEEDSDVIEIEDVSSYSTGRTEDEIEVTNKEKTHWGKGNTSECNEDDTKEEKNDMEVEDDLKSESEDETVTKVVTDTKSKTQERKKQENEQKQNMNNSESQEDSGMEENESSSEVKNVLETEKKATDKIPKDSNSTVKEYDDKNNESMTEKTKNKRKKKSKIIDVHKAETEAEIKVTDKLSNEGSVTLKENDDENNESMTEKSKNKRKKKSKIIDVHKAETEAEIKVTDKLSIEGSVTLKENDDENNESMTEKDKNNRKKKNENMDIVHKAKKDSEAEVKGIDKVPDDSNITTIKENDNKNNGSMPENNENKKLKNKKSVDGSIVPSDDQGNKRRTLRRDRMNDTDTPKTKRRKKLKN